MSKRRQKRRILWVEDSARFELAGLLGPIYASRRYDLTLAENASSAAEYLRHRRFDAMVVDIRIPPGAHRYWLAIYKQRDSDRTNAKLGLELLDWLLGGTHSGTEGRSRIRTAAPARPSWLVSANHIGVFSVESRIEVGATRDRRGVGGMLEKQPGLPDTVLLDLIDQLLAASDSDSDSDDPEETAAGEPVEKPSGGAEKPRP